MTDSKDRLWQLAVAAKQRARRRLEHTLAEQRRDLVVLEQEASERLAEKLAASDTLQCCESDLDRLMNSPGPVPAQRFVDYGTWRQGLETRVKETECAHHRAIDAVADKEDEAKRTCHGIARLDNQVRMCESLLEKARRTREESQASQLEEEAAENISMRSRFARQAC